MISVFLVLLILISTSQVFGQEKKNDQWDFSLTPYLWLAGNHGDAAVKGRSFSVDQDFSDIMENLDFSFQLHFEAQKGKSGLLFDFLFLSFSNDADIRSSTLGSEGENWVLEFGGFHQIAEWRLGQNANRSIYVDALGGFRFWHLGLDVDFETETLGTFSVGDDKNWADPYIGARLNTRFTDKLLFKFRGDIGGFGITDYSSKLTWNVRTDLSYDVSQLITLSLGYRGQGVNYSEGSGDNYMEYDVTMDGVLIGVNFNF